MSIRAIEYIHNLFVSPEFHSYIVLEPVIAIFIVALIESPLEANTQGCET